MKKNFRFMLLGLLAMSSVGTFAQTVDEDGRSINNVIYKLETLGDGTKQATVIGINKSAGDAAKTIVIPKEVTGQNGTYPVKAFDANWITGGGDNKDISGVTETLSIDGSNLPDGALDAIAYNTLTKLKNVKLVDKANGKGLTWVPYFYDNSKMVSVDLENCSGIKTIDWYYMQNATNLETFKVPAGLKGIGGYAFDGCAKLASFSFGGSLESIGQGAFRGTALTAVDLSGTKVKVINNAVFKNTKLTSVKLHAETTGIESEAFENVETLTSIDLPKTVKYVGAYAFSKCKKLATVTTDAKEAALRGISSHAFAYTALAEFTILAGDPTTAATVAASAFEGCAKLKKFNFVGASHTAPCADEIDLNAFIGVSPFVTIYAPQPYIDEFKGFYYPTEAPTNAQWEAKAAPVKVDGKIAIKNKFAKWFHNTKPIAVDASLYKAFSVYVDNGGKKKDGTAYFQGLKLVDGRYYIPAGTHVIFQALDEKATDVEYQDMSLFGLPDNSVLIDEIFSFDKNYTLADFQTYSTTAFAIDVTGNYIPGYYLYRLTNNNGIGFRLFTGVELIGGKDDTADKAQFFIQSVRKPDAAGRLNVIWLDEDGNVISGDATAIEEVETTSNEDGAVYNLAGQKVSASYKGVIIKNGKKYMK